MNRYLIHFSAFIIFTWMHTGLFAQSTNKGEKQHERFEQRLQELSTTLNLSRIQQDHVRAIMKQTRTDAKSIKDQPSDPETRKAKMKELGKQTDNKITAILTEEQQRKYLAYKKEKKEQIKTQTRERDDMRKQMDEAEIL